MNFNVKDYIFVKKEISNNCTDDQIGFTINRTITNFKKKNENIIIFWTYLNRL